MSCIVPVTYPQKHLSQVVYVISFLGILHTVETIFQFFTNLQFLVKLFLHLKVIRITDYHWKLLKVAN
jgi:hypothetical protein